MKRIFAYILVIAFTFSCIVLTASAEEIEMPTSFARSFIDLLQTNTYRFSVNGAAAGSDSTPSLTVSKATSVSISFDVSLAPLYSGLVFQVDCGSKPSSIDAVINGTTISNVTYNNTTNGRHYYRWFNSNNFEIDQLTLTIKFSSAYSGSLGLVTCFGVVSSAQTYNSVQNYSFELYTNINNAYEAVTVDSGNLTDFPINWTTSTSSKNSYLFLRATVAFGATALDSCSFIVETIGEIDNGDISFGIYGGNTLKYLLPVEIIKGKGYSYNLYAGLGVDAFVQKNIYIVNVDLTGVDLGISTGRLMIECPVLQVPQVDSYFAGINLTNYVVRQEVAVTPWYVNFYNWISGTMKEGYQSIVDAITGGDTSEMDNVVNDIKDKNDDVISGIGELEDIERPDIDFNSIASNVTPTNASGLAILSTITHNKYILPLLVLVFSMAVIGFAFFGKKG